MSWWEIAQCRGTTVDFFAEGARDQAPAKALCATCEVRGECLADALAEGRYQFGVRAGYTAAQRERMPRGRTYAATAQCGTDAGYYTHLRRTYTPPCDDCRAAHNAAARRRKVSA